MPEYRMSVHVPEGMTLSRSAVSPGALNPLLRDSNNGLSGMATLTPLTSAPKAGVVVAGLALVGLTIAAVAVAANESSKNRGLNRQLDQARSSDAVGLEAAAHATASPGWYVDAFGAHRWWNGAQWTEHVREPTGSVSPPAGWYDDGTGRTRWWDGHAWTAHRLLAKPAQSEVEAYVAPAKGRAGVEGWRERMTQDEWRQRFRKMVMARAYSDMQWRLLVDADIVDAEGSLTAWQVELRGLTSEQFTDRARRAVEADPSLQQGFGVSTPGWFEDGSGHTRWWDGQQWTEHVQMRESVLAVSTGTGAATRAAPAWYDDGAGRWRYWDGNRWTQHYA